MEDITFNSGREDIVIEYRMYEVLKLVVLGLKSESYQKSPEVSREIAKEFTLSQGNATCWSSPKSVILPDHKAVKPEPSIYFRHEIMTISSTFLLQFQTHQFAWRT